MKYDFTSQLCALNGQELAGPENRLSAYVAEALISNNEANAVKLYALALEIYKAGVIDLSVADYQLLSRILDQSPRITVLVKAQLLARMNSPPLQP